MDEEPKRDGYLLLFAVLTFLAGAVRVGWAGWPPSWGDLACLAVMAALLLTGAVRLGRRRLTERPDVVTPAPPGRALHRVTVAVPAPAAEAAEEVSLASDLRERLAAIDALLEASLAYAHAREVLGEGESVVAALDAAERALADRESAEQSDTAYRASARRRVTREDADGYAVVSLLFVTDEPTTQASRFVRRPSDARSLVDAHAPAGVAAQDTRVVLTPGDTGRSYDRDALRAAFPELVWLPPSVAGGTGPIHPPELPAPLHAFRFDEGTVERDAHDSLRALEAHLGCALPRDALSARLSRHAGRREALLSTIERELNRAARAAGSAAVVSQVLALDGQPVEDVIFVVSTRAERRALRKSGRAAFAPASWERLVGMMFLPSLAAAALCVRSAVRDPGFASVTWALVAVVASFVMHRWVKTRIWPPGVRDRRR